MKNTLSKQEWAISSSYLSLCFSLSYSCAYHSPSHTGYPDICHYHSFLKTLSLLEVPVVAQQVMNLIGIHEDAGSIPDLIQ